ncbi:hypothetical protein [Rhodohalobacter sp. 8-1]|uniref:hypothetical protein n=1 Tax=Rhodohalobacter sp. 8-1 TaxID=3131972 RepID=UPI0030EC86F4
MEKTKSLRVSTLLSVQRALVGEIIPAFRLISVEYSEAEIKIWVYHDGKINANEIEEFDSSVITEVVADFPYPDDSDPKVELEFVRLDYPEKIKPEGWPVYGRRERA